MNSQARPMRASLRAGILVMAMLFSNAACTPLEDQDKADNLKLLTETAGEPVSEVAEDASGQTEGDQSPVEVSGEDETPIEAPLDAETDGHAGTTDDGSMESAPAAATLDVSELGIDGQVLPDMPGDNEFAPEASPMAPMTAEAVALTAQASNNADMGVADVNDLVLDMSKLATFTPGPPAKSDSSQVLFVRNGGLWRSAAAGGKPEKIQMENDMDRIWAPPEDPGRAWKSPKGDQLAYFVGSDAQLWVSDSKGKDNVSVSGPNLPNSIFEVESGSDSQSIRMRPGNFYTLARLDGRDDAFVVYRDDLDEERRGNARLRFAHLMDGDEAATYQIYINGAAFGGPMRFGKSSGEIRTPAGPIRAELRDLKGKVLATLPEFDVASKTIRTIYLTGSTSSPTVSQIDSEHKLPAGSYARVRIFNATEGKVDSIVTDSTGKINLVSDLEPYRAGPFVDVKSVLSTEQLAELRLAIYGNRTREEPVAWSSDNKRVAFVGGSDGLHDLYVGQAGKKAVRLTQDNREEINPVWSPDGENLVWLARELSVVLYELQYRRGEGPAETVNMAPFKQALGLTPTSKVFFPKDPHWIDDDRFVILPVVELEAFGIWVVDTRDGSVKPIYRDSVANPVWSADEKAWLFTPNDETGTIIRVDLKGNAKTLAEGNFFHPIWSPDAKQISYVEGDQLDSAGWKIFVADSDGGNARAVTPAWPLMQFEPPVPGPNAKRYWHPDGKHLIISRVGRDYGAAERAGLGQVTSAGPDIENWHLADLSGKSDPVFFSDMTQAFYLDAPATTKAGDNLVFTGFWYQSRTKQLWSMPVGGGSPNN